MKRLSKTFAIALIFVVVATLSAQAQLYYGVKAGANISTAGVPEALKARSEYGYQVGVVVGAEVPIIGIGIEAEGLWIENKISFTDNQGAIYSKSIEVPVMASIPVLPIIPLRIKAGPSFMLYNKAKLSYSDGATKELDAIKSSIGYTVGFGLNLARISFDVRFNGQFKSSTPFNSIFGKNTPSKYYIRANTFSASLGYRF